MPKVRFLTATACLLVMGCSQSETSGQENQAFGDVAANGMISDDAGIEQEPQLAQLPVPSADLPSEQVAPLAQAAAAASEIEQAEDVERIAYDGGWAWRRNGQILRTASSDGRRVSYFRSGETTPYLVQDGDRAFAYSGGRVQGAYDGQGRAVRADPARRAEVEQLARQSSEQRTRALRVAEEQPQRVRQGRNATPDVPPAAGQAPRGNATDGRPGPSQSNHSRREGSRDERPVTNRATERAEPREARPAPRQDTGNNIARPNRERGPRQ